MRAIIPAFLIIAASLGLSPSAEACAPCGEDGWGVGTTVLTDQAGTFQWSSGVTVTEDSEGVYTFTIHPGDRFKAFTQFKGTEEGGTVQVTRAAGFYMENDDTVSNAQNIYVTVDGVTNINFSTNKAQYGIDTAIDVTTMTSDEPRCVKSGSMLLCDSHPSGLP